MRRIVTLTTVVLLLLALTPMASARGDASQRQLRRYAADTWGSFVAMTNEQTGLPADNLVPSLRSAPNAKGARSAYTSPTNIGAYLWSTVVARDLGLVSRTEAHARMRRTLASVAELERHQPSGQFFNWYDPATGEVLDTWPVDGNPVYPFLSSVDNGWLATGLRIVSAAEPRLRRQADALYDSMDFGFYYDPQVGQIRGGYWTELPPDQVHAPQISGGCQNAPSSGETGAGFTCHHYGALNTEPRITSYLGIANGQIPREHYFRTYRTFPPTCDWNWQEQRPGGEWRTYLGVDVFEGHYTYGGVNVVPTWGGSMFEALMVPLFVPEEDWGPRSWGVNHPLYVQAQIYHGLEDADYGYWGFSPSNDPAGGYREYGVDAIGMDSPGYTSDQQRTSIDFGWDDPACPREPSIPSDYGDGVVTPHASFLALDFARDAALANLEKLRRDFDVYGRYGFYDAVDVGSGQVSRYYLALDQGMIMAALGNELRNDHLQRYVVDSDLRRTVRPLLQMERFTAGRESLLPGGAGPPRVSWDRDPRSS